MRSIVMLCFFLLSLVPSSVNAQSGQDCDPLALADWVQSRQQWRTESQEVLDAQGVSVDSAMLQLADHLMKIEDLKRPGCADEAMLWTYYLYTNFEHLLLCARVGDAECRAETQQRLQDYRVRDEQAMSALVAQSGLPQSVLYPPTPTPAPPTATPKPAPQTKMLGPIWDAIRDESFAVELSVSNVRSMKQSGYSVAKEGFVYIAADISFRNLGPGAMYSVSSMDFEVKDASGALRSDSWAVDDCDFDLVDLVPGGSVSGCIAFEVPATGALELIYAPYKYEGLQEGRYLSFKIR